MRHNIFAGILLYLFCSTLLWATPGESGSGEKREEGSPRGLISDRETKEKSKKQLLHEIGENWMATIHGEESKQEVRSEDSSSRSAPTDATASERDEESRRVRLANPAPEEAASPSRVAPAAPSADGGSEAAVDSFYRTGPVEAPSFFSVVLRFVGLMTLLIGLLYVLVRYVKRKTGLLPTGGGELMEVVATIPLMPGKNLQIVELAGQLLVLGVSDSSVNLIQTVEDAAVADRIRLWHSGRIQQQGGDSPVDFFRSLLGGRELPFWSGEGEGRRRSFPRFQDLLQARSGGSGESSRGDEESLKELLRSQKEKITALRHSSTEPQGPIPGSGKK